MPLSASVSAQQATGFGGLLAMVGFTPSDAPLLLFAIVGTFFGMVAAFPKDRQYRAETHTRPGQWILDRLALFGGIVFFVLGLEELFSHDIGPAIGLSVSSPRVFGAVAFVMMFSGLKGLSKIEQRWLKEIDKRKAPGGED